MLPLEKNAGRPSEPLLLRSKDLRECLPMEDAIGAVEAAFAERHARTGVSPPRTRWEVPPSALTLTPGGFQGQGVLGFRVYVRGTRQDQLTAVWDVRDGRLEGLVVGPELGEIRTGAIGGVAAKWMAPADTPRVGIIGGGRQSRTQLLALRSVRPMIKEVVLYRRDASRRKDAAQRLKQETGLDVRPVESARQAVQDVQLVVLATDSSEPVVEAKWLLPGAHVNSLGPKYRGQTEIGLDLLESADWLASDFPEQYDREEDFIAHGTALMGKIRDLADLIASRPKRDSGLRTVFLSHGLAGTEVAVAHRAITNAARMGVGIPITG